jgi:hypothetical protein
MADFLASQRVRLFDGTNDKGFATGQPLIVRLSDGTDLSLIDGNGNLQVILAANDGVDIGNVDVTSVVPGTNATQLGKAVDNAAGATDTGVAALAVRDDVLSTLTPADGDYVNLRTDANGALWVTLTAAGNSNVKQDDSAFTPATDYVGVAGFFADETAPDSVNEGDIGAARMTLDRKQLMVLVDATTDTQRLAIDSSGNAQVDLAAVSVTAVPVSKDSSANSESNPIFVQVVSGVLSGIEVVFYGTAANITANNTGNVDYTVSSAKTAKVQWIRVSASGAFKATVSVGPLASLVTKEVIFAAPAMPQGQMEYGGLLEVPDTSTGTIRVTIRNDDNQTMDAYVTMVMTEV